jgi:predicted ribosomally synthesized peptide with nif11-like leader
MSRIEVRRFMNELQTDPGRLEEFKRVATDFEAALGWTKVKGYDLTEAELRDLLDYDRELSDDELEEAAGGDDVWPPV